MFSSNQVFQISGSMEQLEMSLRFVLDFSGQSRRDLVFQITDDGKYCIGWKSDTGTKGWQQFQFDFDVSIVARIIIQHLRKQEDVESGYEEFDGSTGEGFIMNHIPNIFSDEWQGIKNPFYGIVYFAKFSNFYAK